MHIYVVETANADLPGNTLSKKSDQLVCILQTEIVQRLSGGAQSGRAAAAEKALEKIKEEGSLVEKPFVARKRTFA